MQIVGFRSHFSSLMSALGAVGDYDLSGSRLGVEGLPEFSDRSQ